MLLRFHRVHFGGWPSTSTTSLKVVDPVNDRELTNASFEQQRDTDDDDDDATLASRRSADNDVNDDDDDMSRRRRRRRVYGTRERSKGLVNK